MSSEPTTKESFSATVRQQAVDKVDLLFMIDNSASMGDKQALLALAVPDLVKQLLQPQNGEFEPVHDMHIAVVSSSLGGSDACTSARSDDKAHLLGPGFLSWLPDVPKNAGKPRPQGVITDNAQLQKSFADLVVGVGENGCGLEAQLESWYRFLVQPDPYDSLALGANGRAQMNGVDQTILQERQAFLRPDSLLAVIVVTDEEDSWSDPMWQGGQGWRTRYQNNGWTTYGALPRGTSICATSPSSPDCKPCDGSTAGDPNCQLGVYKQTEDLLNVRYTDDMKRRYGIEPQFPIQRYIDGLRAIHVPDRNGRSCINPIYADLGASTDPCTLERGPRTSDLVYFAVIGGIPQDLTSADWSKDPRMVESIAPRSGVAGDWNTSTSNGWLDLQYACTFDLQAPRDCSVPNTPACDCSIRNDGVQSDSPLCAPNPNDGMRRTLQTKGKAYPTIRELNVVRGMEDNGIVASLCPKSLDPQSPDFGYRPAVRSIIDRLKARLGGQCLPQPLVRDSNGMVSCSLLTIVSAPDQASACPPRGMPDGRGLQQPDPDVLAAYNHGKTPDEIQPVCELTQRVGTPSCDNDGTPGWCYVEGGEAGKCQVGSAQAIKFGAEPVGPTVIQCIQQR